MNITILFIALFGAVIFFTVAFIIKTMLWFVVEDNPKPILAVKVPGNVSGERIAAMKAEFKKSEMGREYHILTYVDEVKLLDRDLKKISKDEDREENNSSGR